MDSRLDRLSTRLRRAAGWMITFTICWLSAGFAQQIVQSGAAAVGFTLIPATSGNLIPYHLVSTGGANQDQQVIKGSPGQLYHWNPSSINASPIYLKLYNMTSGCTSASTPAKTILIPGNVAGAGNNADVAQGIAFSTGICARLTTGMADNDTGAVTSGTVSVDLDYF